MASTTQRVKTQNFSILTILSALFVIICFPSCQSDKPTKEVEIPQEPSPTSVWVSVKNEADVVIRLRFQTGLNDSIQESHLSVKPLDTLVINLTEERLMVIESKVSLKKDVLVSPGDSLYVDLVSDQMKITSNREQLFANTLSAQFPTEQSANIDSLHKLLVYTDSTNSMLGFNDYSKTRLYPVLFQKDFIENNPEVLSEFVSATYLEIEGIRNKVNNELQKVDGIGLDMKEEIELHRHFLRLSFLSRRLEDKSYVKSLLESPFFEEDFLMQSKYGVAYLFYYISQGILAGEEIKTSNKRYTDYPKAYDLLEQHFSGKLLARARLFCLERMVSNNVNYETIGQYATKYQNTYPEDTAFIQRFQDNFLLSQEALVQSAIGLNLLTESGMNKDLTGLLNDLKGKVVYVDYWASWCAPCRVAMPHSMALRRKMKDQDVAFVYFSVDNGQEAWKQASESDGLNDYKHNYLVLNHEKSEMRRNLNIDAIPRYLIFNKEGKLVERNAPSPKDANLEAMLNKYIAN
ncbi:TlpA family protein disulfide reductase [Roseivirga sp.]|uniref:TlpA family protein disulfide reductase n=1 Tax=Roseivirga sp. TaxID=1964215 RepID=UPI003B8B0116